MQDFNRSLAEDAQARLNSGIVMALIKALVPGFLLTWVVSLIIGSNGSRGGILAIQHSVVEGHSFYWSWPLFIAGTALAWALFAMMD